MLSSGVPADELVAMKLNALLVDPTVLGDEGWELPRAGLRDAPRTSASSSAPAARPSPSACAACGSGVDDWITKPCHPEEAMARIEAVVAPPPPRRASSSRPGRSSPASWRSAPTSSRPSSAASSLDLTRREFELLQLLADAQGQVLEREAIYQRVWGYAMAHGDRSVDVFIRKLRQKLEKRSPELGYIHTHFGVGYRFDPEPVGGAGVDPVDADVSADDAAPEPVDLSPRAA